MRLILSAVLAIAVATPVLAKPPLRDVAEIDDGLMAIAIADEIRKSCDDISARMVRAMSTIRSLKKRAEALGYSDEEIDDYVTSKAEKKRMRAKATAYLSSRGVEASDTKALCRFGKTEISRETDIGRLLR